MAVLATKTYLPHAHGQLVARERLFEKMSLGVEEAARLILVCAPAGFGKSTLVSAWAGTQNAPAAWLSLDERDAIPERFFAYLIAAIQRVHPGFAGDLLDRIHRGEARGLHALLPELVNALGEVPLPLVVILDDYHAIDEPEIHDGLAFLVDRAPPGVTFLLVTRVVPPLSLPRRRARRELVDIRLEDLRFTADETVQFFNDLHDLGLDPQDVATLEARTEGWAAGLQMVALALPDDAARRREFIGQFGGSQEYIADYLLEEVLGREPAALTEFLLRISVLERFCAPLCQALTGEPDAESMLRSLWVRNAFLIPLDAERRWFRLHHLFADLLRTRLERDQAPLVPELHLRACAWFEANGYVQDAMSHAIAGRSFLTVQRLVHENWTDMLHRGHIADRLRWLNALPRMATQPNLMPDVLQATLAWLATVPAQTFEGYPALHTAYAWALFLSGRLDEAEAQVSRAEQALAGDASMGLPTGAEGGSLELRADSDTLRVFLLHARGALEAVVEHVQDAGSRAQPASPLHEGGLRVILGDAYQRLDRPELAAQAYREGSTLAWRSGNVIGTLSAYAGLIGSYLSQSNLPLAERAMQEALQLMDEHQIQRVPAAGVVHLERAALHLVQNRISEASSALDLAAEVAAHSRLPGFHQRCAALRARLAPARAASDPATLMEPLTARELEVLALVADGCSNQEISERLAISLPTVKKHVSNILAKTYASSRTKAIVRAREAGIL